VVIVTAILTAGAILRATAGIFGGWGTRRELSEAAAPTIVRETEGPLRRTPPTMLAPAFAMLLIALLIGLVPSVAHGIDRSAEAFVARTSYAKAVLLEAHPTLPSVAPSPWWDAATLREAAITTLGAAIVMLLGIFGRALVNGTTERLLRPFQAVIGVVRAAHDGHVGNYVAWMSAGTAILGGVFLLGYR
jgi:multicomponent Na+:H+ antiporter subunit D